MSSIQKNKPLPKYLTDRKFKMSAVFSFEVKEAKKHKVSSFWKGCFYVMSGPMDMNFGMFS